MYSTFALTVTQTCSFLTLRLDQQTSYHILFLGYFSSAENDCYWQKLRGSQNDVGLFNVKKTCVLGQLPNLIMLSSGEGPFLAALRREAAGARAEKIVADDGTFKPDDDQDVKAFDLIFSLVR